MYQKVQSRNRPTKVLIYSKDDSADDGVFNMELGQLDVHVINRR